MGYVLESNAIKYMLEDFPKRLMPDKWETFQESCHKGISITDRETLKELELMVAEAESLDWIDNNKKFFIAINEKDANALGELMTQGIFNFYIGSPEFKRKLPVASPFLVAMAKSKKKTFVLHKTNTYRNHLEAICDDVNVRVIGVEDYLMEL